MAKEERADDVERILADEKLAKLGYHANSGKSCHHKKSTAAPAGEGAKPAAKPKA